MTACTVARNIIRAPVRCPVMHGGTAVFGRLACMAGRTVERRAGNTVNPVVTFGTVVDRIAVGRMMNSGGGCHVDKIDMAHFTIRFNRGFRCVAVTIQAPEPIGDFGDRIMMNILCRREPGAVTMTRRGTASPHGRYGAVAGIAVDALRIGHVMMVAPFVYSPR